MKKLKKGNKKNKNKKKAWTEKVEKNCYCHYWSLDLKEEETRTRYQVLDTGTFQQYLDLSSSLEVCESNDLSNKYGDIFY